MSILPIYIVFAINILTSVVKKWIFPKWGKFGVQLFVFALALIGAAYLTYEAQIPGLSAVVAAAFGLFSLAVTFYEVILSYIPIFKQSPVESGELEVL